MEYTNVDQLIDRNQMGFKPRLVLYKLMYLTVSVWLYEFVCTSRARFILQNVVVLYCQSLTKTFNTLARGYMASLDDDLYMCISISIPHMYVRSMVFIGAALKCAPIMEWEFILASGRSSF